MTRRIGLMALLITACGSPAVQPGTTVGTTTTAATTTVTTTATTTTTSTLPPTTTTTTIPLAEIAVGVERVAGGFEQPIFVTTRPGDPRLFVADQVGIVYALVDDERTVVLDINTLTRFAGEQGLLGLAFHPDDPSRMFVHYSDNAGDTVVAEYSFPLDAVAAAPGAVQTLFALDQPASNHNGGMIVFGPDGYFYLGLGDGGGGGDPWENAQDPFALLGKILRVAVTGAEGYEIPPDNPFADGVEGAPEVWLLGLRNPWRFSFDAGFVWIGDVGQNAREEIDRVSMDDPGANLGWDVLEGTECYEGTADECAAADLVAPLLDYPHDGRCSVTGGYVYRGTEIPALVGAYIFSDWCTGGLHALRIDASGRLIEEALLIETGWRLTSFGVDLDGELYFTREDGVFRVVASEP